MRLLHSGRLSALWFQVDYVVSTLVLPGSLWGFVCLPNCMSCVGTSVQLFIRAYIVWLLLLCALELQQSRKIHKCQWTQAARGSGLRHSVRCVDVTPGDVSGLSGWLRDAIGWTDGRYLSCSSCSTNQISLPFDLSSLWVLWLCGIHSGFRRPVSTCVRECIKNSSSWRARHCV